MMENNTDQKSNQFFIELTSLINRYSIDSKAETPDYVLAEYMIDCLKTFCSSLKNRMAHVYGKSTQPKEWENGQFMADMLDWIVAKEIKYNLLGWYINGIFNSDGYMSIPDLITLYKSNPKPTKLDTDK